MSELVPSDLRELEPRDDDFLRSQLGRKLDQSMLDEVNAYFVRERVNARVRLPRDSEDRFTAVIEPLVRD